MARVLAISSEVVRGHVGNSAARLALQRLGHEVWSIPTVILSNHLGYKTIAGTRIEPDLIDKMLNAIEANGWMAQIDAIMTGYLPTAEHVVLTAEWIRRLRPKRDLLVLCDPVIGDDPMGLYVDASAAEAVRDRLVPIADLITPNRFELEWLTGRPVTGRDTARQAAGGLACTTTIGTSIPVAGEAALDTVLMTGGKAMVTRVPKVQAAQHGTGDFFAALYLGHVLAGRTPTEALGRAVGGVKAALDESMGKDELQLAPSNEAWSAVPPWPVERLDDTKGASR